MVQEPVEDKVIEEKVEQAEKLVSKRPEIILKKRQATSGLSLKSIAKKKEHELKQIEVVLDEEALPEDSFTEAELIDAWNLYHSKLEKQGKRNMASILKIDKPKLIDQKIALEFPNETNKVELERHQGELLSFIRKKLNNYKVGLEITVNEEIEKQYVFSPQDKYKRFKEKNPAIETLKRTFDLDI